jgi:hypothetical protein
MTQQREYTIALIIAISWTVIMYLMIVFAHFSTPDFTDTGIGCTDDCIDLDTHK